MEKLWQLIENLDRETRYGDENGFLLCAPELVDLDCNVHGVGPGYWQDDGEKPGGGSWLCAKFDMHSDCWNETECHPTHFIQIRGPR